MLNAQEVGDLFEGLRSNNLLHFSHVLTGQSLLGCSTFLRCAHNQSCSVSSQSLFAILHLSHVLTKFTLNLSLLSLYVAILHFLDVLTG